MVPRGGKSGDGGTLHVLICTGRGGPTGLSIPNTGAGTCGISSGRGGVGAWYAAKNGVRIGPHAFGPMAGGGSRGPPSGPMPASGRAVDAHEVVSSPTARAWRKVGATVLGVEGERDSFSLDSSERADDGCDGIVPWHAQSRSSESISDHGMEATSDACSTDDGRSDQHTESASETSSPSRGWLSADQSTESASETSSPSRGWMMNG